MMCSDRQHKHAEVVTKCFCAWGLRNSQGVNGINSLRRLHAEDLFPIQTFVALDLLPRQLSNLAQRIQCSMALGLL
jgi:hypothetical protein